MMMRFSLCVVAVLLMHLCHACAAAPKHQVFIASHTHLDPGWLWPMETYFFNQVQYICNTLVQNLLNVLKPTSTTRVFNWCEVSFLERCWSAFNDHEKSLVTQLVKARRVGFVGGGFVMNDEAVTSFASVVDQMTLGHVFLARNFGLDAVPRTGWQIDPFGASAVMPLLLRGMNFTNHVIDRVDYSLKETWKKEKRLEFRWAGLLTHCLADHYSSPESFDFEGDPFANPPLTPRNATQRANEFVRIVLERAAYFRTDKLLILMGDDFRYVNANMMFQNIDRLLDAVNANSSQSGVVAEYGLVDEYFDAVEKDAPNLPVWDADQDLFPYRKNRQTPVPFQWFTGFYSSRPVLKREIRILEDLYRVSDSLLAVKGAEGSGCSECSSLLEDVKRAVAIVQHHDAITGTASNETVASYEAMIRVAAEKSVHIAAQLTSGSATSVKWKDDVGYVAVVDSVPSVLNVFNSLGWPREELICVALDPEIAKLSAVGIRGKISQRDDDGGTLCFVAMLPAFGIMSYVVDTGLGTDGFGKWVSHAAGAPVVLSNRFVKAEFDETGTLVSMNGIPITASGVSFNTSNIPNEYMSNRYYFIPNTTDISGYHSVPPDETAGVFVLRGPVFDELTQVRAKNFSTTFRVVKSAVTVELGGQLLTRVRVGPIAWNRDVALRIQVGNSQLSSRLFTDQNGFVMRERSVYCSNCSVGGLFNPSTVAATMLVSSQNNITLLMDRPHGVAHDGRGTMFVVLHRRFNCTNSPVLGQPLNDTTVAHVHFALRVGQSSARSWRTLSSLFNHPSFVLVGKSLQQQNATYLSSPTGLHRDLHFYLSHLSPRERVLRLYNGGTESVLVNWQQILRTSPLQKAVRTSLNVVHAWPFASTNVTLFRPLAYETIKFDAD